MIAIVDYDAGNIRSVERAVSYIGEESILTDDPKEIMAADKVILPGVGAFGAARRRLSKGGLDEAIVSFCGSGKPFLGICLGLQLLFDSSEEEPGTEGLHILPGKIKRFPSDMDLKVPQIGWNSLSISHLGRLFEGIDQGAYVYFVHSYYLEAADKNDVTATTDYGVLVHASVERGNIFACQFHPEKSGEVGLAILRNFCKLS